MKSIFIISLSLLSICFHNTKTFAQDSLGFNKKYIAKNNANIELVGVGVNYSLNFERNFGIKDKTFHTIRAGVGYFPPTGFDQIILPISYTYSIGKRKSKFFLGIGLTLLISPDPYPNTFAKRQQVRKHPYDTNIYGDPNSEGFEPLINLVLCPIIGYEIISRKRFYFKAYINGFLFRDQLIHYLAFPYAGFTFGFKLGKKAN